MLCSAEQNADKLRFAADEPDLDGLQDFDDVQSQQDFDAMSQTWSQKVCPTSKLATASRSPQCNQGLHDVALQVDLSRPMPLALVDTNHKYKTSVSLKVPRYAEAVCFCSCFLDTPVCAKPLRS